MDPYEVESRAAHPAGKKLMRARFEADQFDAWAEEAIALTEAAQRMPIPARRTYDTIAAGFAGALVGVLAVIGLLVEGGAL